MRFQRAEMVEFPEQISIDGMTAFSEQIDTRLNLVFGADLNLRGFKFPNKQLEFPEKVCALWSRYIYEFLEQR